MIKVNNFQSIINISKCIYIIFVVSVISIGTTGSYFSDTVTIDGNQFSTGTWSNIVINEVYYDTDARTFGNGNSFKTEEEGKNEWIELYNPNSFPINIKDWSITDNTYTKLVAPNIDIPANGFALLSHDNSTWHFWGDPSGADIEIINLTGNTDWLSNDGDKVVLKDSSGSIVDQMSYGDNTTVFSPACADVGQGHSLERKTLGGTDTNTAADFIKMTTPTPGS